MRHLIFIALALFSFNSFAQEIIHDDLSEEITEGRTAEPAAIEARNIIEDVPVTCALIDLANDKVIEEQDKVLVAGVDDPIEVKFENKVVVVLLLTLVAFTPE